MTDLPSLDAALALPIDLQRLETGQPAPHKLRILLLYGSLRQRS